MVVRVQYIIQCGFFFLGCLCVEPNAHKTLNRLGGSEKAVSPRYVVLHVSYYPCTLNMFVRDHTSVINAAA